MLKLVNVGSASIGEETYVLFKYYYKNHEKKLKIIISIIINSHIFCFANLSIIDIFRKLQMLHIVEFH